MNKNEKIIPFPSQEDREQARKDRNQEMIEKASEEGMTGDSPERVFQAISERAHEITKGQPFRFKRGRPVRVKRSSGEVQDSWEVFDNNPSMGWVRVLNKSEKLEKKISWTDLYEVNQDLQEGDIVTVKRSSGELDNGWTIDAIEGSDAYVSKGEGRAKIEKTIPLDELKEVNP